jgi:hypothetical protein
MNLCANAGWFYLIILILNPGSDGLRDVRLEGPDYIREGEDVTFTCKYDLETDMLYAVKWYRGSEEFYM